MVKKPYFSLSQPLGRLSEVQISLQDKPVEYTFTIYPRWCLHLLAKIAAFCLPGIFEYLNQSFKEDHQLDYIGTFCAQ